MEIISTLGRGKMLTKLTRKIIVVLFSTASLCQPSNAQMSQQSLKEPELDIFGMALGNKWKYEGTFQGQLSLEERNITEINQSSFPVPVFVNEHKENGIFAGEEYYENTGEKLKLWGLSFLDDEIFFVGSFTEGLVVAWAPIEVGDHNYSTTLLTIDQLPGHTFTTDLTGYVESLETVTLEFGTFEAYKINYTLTMSGHDLDSIDNFSEWIVPYLGVVKYEDAETSMKLTSFSIGGGIISEKSDADNDGLIDFLELTVYETNWLKADTDGDGFTDDEEILCGSDPVDSGSKCSRGLPWLQLLLDN